MQFTRENIQWCCSDESQSTFEGFAFFLAKGLSKRLLPQVGQAVSNGLKISICLSKNIKVPKVCGQEICRRNIVMGDVEYYRKMMTGTSKTWL
jgi:hypothetical protein